MCNHGTPYVAAAADRFPSHPASLRIGYLEDGEGLSKFDIRKTTVLLFHIVATSYDEIESGYPKQVSNCEKDTCFDSLASTALLYTFGYGKAAGRQRAYVSALTSTHIP